MRRIVVGAMVSMDGVMQAPGAPEEDPSGGFRFGGWVAPLNDDDPGFNQEFGRQFAEPFDLLLGRRTYEIFAAYWPFREGGPHDYIAKTFNHATKYVATRKGVALTWGGSVALRDAAKDVARLKEEEGPLLLTQGSTELVHTLLAAGLVDEVRTFTFPVVLGRGKRLFSDDSQPRVFKLTKSAVSPKGLIHATYARDGEVTTQAIDDTQKPSAAELARRERLKTE